LRGLLAIVGAAVLVGCEGSWLYPVAWPDRTGLRLVATTADLHIWSEPQRAESGLWDPFIEVADLHTAEVLDLLEIQRVERVDVYLHGVCFDPVGAKDCVRLKGQAAGPDIIDLWFGKGYRRRTDLQLSVLRHEFAHVATAQSNGGCPRYLLEEGLAEYARLSGSGPVHDQDVPGTTLDDLADALRARDGDWIPLVDVVNTADFIRKMGEGTGGLLYAEAGALAEHLLHVGGLDTYLTLQQRTCSSNEETFHAVFRELYGADLVDIDQALRHATEVWE